MTEEMNTSALRMPKSFEDVTEAILLDEDWYEMRLIKKALLPNGALKKYIADEGIKAKTPDELYSVAAAAKDFTAESYGKVQVAGLNYMLSVKTVSQDKMVNGRAFRIYLPVPNVGDDKKVTPLGQTVEDSKMEKIGKHLIAFGQLAEGDQADFTPGDSAMFYVVQRFSDFSGKDENTIDIGNEPQPVV